jgi:hypothetical protein
MPMSAAIEIIASAQWRISAESLTLDLAVAVRQPGSAPHFMAQNDQLMSERRVLCLKPALRLEW